MSTFDILSVHPDHALPSIEAEVEDTVMSMKHQQALRQFLASCKNEDESGSMSTITSTSENTTTTRPKTKPTGELPEQRSPTTTTTTKKRLRSPSWSPSDSKSPSPLAGGSAYKVTKTTSASTPKPNLNPPSQPKPIPIPGQQLRALGRRISYIRGLETLLRNSHYTLAEVKWPVETIVTSFMIDGLYRRE